MFSPLRNTAYRNLFVAQVITLVGTGFTTIGLALLAREIAGDDAGLVLGIALALKMLAYVGIAPVAGAFAHFLPRRTTLTFLSIVRGALVCALPIVTEAFQIYLAIFFLNAFAAAYTPLFQATIPDILPDEKEYTRALSLSRLAYDLENLFSPVVAAIALVFMGFSMLFVLNSALFVCAAILILFTRIPSPDSAGRTAVNQVDLLFGLRSYFRTPRLRGLLAVSFAVACASAMVIVNTVVYVQGRLARSDSEVAVAMAFAGAGSMLVAFTLPRLLDRVTDRTVLFTGGTLLAAALLTGALGPGLYALYLLWFVLGAGWSLIQTPAGRVLQRSCLPADRPAFYAAHFSLTHVCWLVTYPLVGFLGARFELEIAFAVMAIIAGFATLTGFVTWRDDPRRLRHRHEPVQHTHAHVRDEHHRHSHRAETEEASEPHTHPHTHEAIEHEHSFIIDIHHPTWPR